MAKRRGAWVIASGIGGAALVFFLVLSASALLWLKVPAGSSLVQDAGAAFHASTAWHIAPSYAHDALSFFNYLSDNDYYQGLFDGPDAQAIAKYKQAMSRKERAAVARIDWLLRKRLGIIISSALLGLYGVAGEPDLDEFALLLEQPSRFRKEHGEKLDAFYRFRTGGWRLPAFLFDRLCLDAATVLRFLRDKGFPEYWEATVQPDLERLAVYWEQSVRSYNPIVLIEGLLGQPLPNNEVVVRLTRFSRPHGFSLGGSVLVMEERADSSGLLRTVLHESLHGWIDWSGDPVLAGIAREMAKDTLVKVAYKARRRDAGYNSSIALAEESLVKAMDQFLSDKLGIGENALMRWFFHDGGLHVAAPHFLSVLTGGLETAEAGLSGNGLSESELAANGGARTSLAERLRRAAERGAFSAGNFTRTWEKSFGIDRPGSLPERPRIIGAYSAGDPRLLALHESYADALKPGMVLLFLDDWLIAGTAERSLSALSAAAARPGAGLSLVLPNGERIALAYAFGGNWGTTRDGRDFFYRNALYCELSGLQTPPPGSVCTLVADDPDCWDIALALGVRF